MAHNGSKRTAHSVAHLGRQSRGRSSILGWLQSQATRVFEETGDYRSEDEPSDVSQVSHTGMNTTVYPNQFQSGWSSPAPKNTILHTAMDTMNCVIL